MIALNIHHVTAIELVSVYRENSGCRTIRITPADGDVELHLFGETEALDALPKAADYHEFRKRAA